MDREKLVELAHAAGVEIDKRWGVEKIADALEKAGVALDEMDDDHAFDEVDDVREDLPALATPPVFELPEADRISTKVLVEPVFFSATIGRIYIHDGKREPTNFGIIEHPPLIVDFGEGHGEEAHLTGGLSRAFYPDKYEHADDAYCDCAECLDAVRAWIRTDKHGLVRTWHIREEDVNPVQKPYAGFDDAHPADLEGMVKKGVITDIRAAIKWELKHNNRGAIIRELDRLGAVPAEPEDQDILAAEVRV